MEYENKFVGLSSVTSHDLEILRYELEYGWKLALMPNDVWYNYPYHIMNRRSMTDFAFKQCIPYEGNEHLLGTTKDVEG